MSPQREKIELAALTIAGSDSCGGAGLQADLRTFQAMDVFGASVVTAVTAQNTIAVHATEPISADVITAQLHAVLDDLPIRAIKTGMLPDAAAIEAVSDVLNTRCRDLPLIVDPVLVATSGASLTLEDTVSALRDRLIPQATLVTPNLEEAGVLASAGAGDTLNPSEAARELLSLGCGAVLLKGGHEEGDNVTDLLVTGEDGLAFRHPKLPGDYHGTGCVLSAAITGAMARGLSLEKAVHIGISRVRTAIGNARRPVRGKLHLISI